MTHKTWWQIVARVPSALVEDVSGSLYEHGCLGLELRDSQHLEPPAGLPQGFVELRAHFPAEVEGLAERVAQAFARLGASAPALEITRISDENWVDSFRAHFAPIQIGRFYVHPSWIEAPASGGFPGESLSIQIDPGMAFGTGMHATTKLCLSSLDGLLDQQAIGSLLDLGSGTGILAIAAARAGVARVVAVDNDPEAVRVTSENLVQNGLTERVEVGDALAAVTGPFDAILANILSGVLLELAPEIERRLAPGGALLLSGILETEWHTVAAGYERLGLSLEDRRTSGEWTLLKLRKAG